MSKAYLHGDRRQDAHATADVGTFRLERFPRASLVCRHVAGPSGSGKQSASLRMYSITELVRLLERAGLVESKQ